MNSASWRSLFERKALPSFPWSDRYLLTASEREIVAASLEQFQLGEGSEGKGVKARAKASPLAQGDPDFLAALDLFIREEQRHSSDLGRFLDREGIARLKGHWVDGVFRHLRKLAGLEVSLSVLVTAEIIAVPYYLALADATASPLLRAICARIIDDEMDHLRYQSHNLSRLRWRRRWRNDFGRMDRVIGADVRRFERGVGRASRGVSRGRLLLDQIPLRVRAFA